MPFPKTDTELAARGYEYENKAHCKECDAEIEWWRTPNNQEKCNA